MLGGFAVREIATLVILECASRKRPLTGDGFWPAPALAGGRRSTPSGPRDRRTRLAGADVRRKKCPMRS